ncbi:MAG: hypothetical protein ACE5LS_09260 [Thermoplasmata archaeon]
MRRAEDSRASRDLRRYARWEYGDREATWLIRSAVRRRRAKRKRRMVARLGSFLRALGVRDASESV